MAVRRKVQRTEFHVSEEERARLQPGSIPVSIQLFNKKLADAEPRWLKANLTRARRSMSDVQRSRVIAHTMKSGQTRNKEEKVKIKVELRAPAVAAAAAAAAAAAEAGYVAGS